MPFQTGSIASVISGPGAMDQLSGLCGRCNARSVLLVTDTGVHSSGWPQHTAQRMAAQTTVQMFVAPPGEAAADTVNRAAGAVRGMDRPLVIGLGGGSALDIAKLVAALQANPGPVEDYLLGEKPWRDRCAAIMIPTAAGTGSEVTRTSIVTDARGRKLWAWGEALRPDAVILDPALTRTLPHSVRVATGLDAFIHALESASGGNRHPFVEAPALQAIRLVRRTLPRVLAHPHQTADLQAMQEAATLAGMAIDAGGTGMAHNIGHALGSLYHIPHGVAVSVGLHASIAWSVKGVPAAFDAIAEAMQPGATSAQVPSLVAHLLSGVDFFSVLRPVAPPHISAAEMAQAMQAPENRPMASNSARVPEVHDWQLLAAQVQRSVDILQQEVVP